MCPVSTRDETEPKFSNAKLVEPPPDAKPEKFLLLGSASASGAVAEAPAVQAPSPSVGKRKDGASCFFTNICLLFATELK